MTCLVWGSQPSCDTQMNGTHSVHGLGHVLKLFNTDWGPLGDVVLTVLALGAMWLGFRYSNRSTTLPSIRHRPLDKP